MRYYNPNRAIFLVTTTQGRRRQSLNASTSNAKKGYKGQVFLTTSSSSSSNLSSSPITCRLLAHRLCPSCELLDINPTGIRKMVSNATSTGIPNQDAAKKRKGAPTTNEIFTELVPVTPETTVNGSRVQTGPKKIFVAQSNKVSRYLGSIFNFAFRDLMRRS